MRNQPMSKSSFPYFIEKSAPVSKSKSLLEYTCRFIGSTDNIAGQN
jgi:hypothetical protein